MEELRSELVPISHNKCSTSTCERILDAIAKDNVKQDDYQSERDVVTKGIVSDIKHYNEQLKLVDGKQILICISRRLINIIYGMLKNGTEYCMPVAKLEDKTESV